MKRGVALLVTGLTFLSTLQGCSSSYQPARSPRIVIVMKGGAPSFVKDGTSYGSPLFGSGLVDAVHGNPRAESEARVGRNLAIGGFVFDMVGFGSEIAGLAAVRPDTQGNPHNNDVPVGLLLGGLASLTVGTVLFLTAPPHIYDAVNIYNDGLDAQVPILVPLPPSTLPPPALTPPGAGPRSTSHE